jgi:hypothetical protein
MVRDLAARSSANPATPVELAQGLPALRPRVGIDHPVAAQPVGRRQLAPGLAVQLAVPLATVDQEGQLVASVTELARDESRPGPLGEVELHQVVEGSMMITWGSAAFPPVTMAWSIR